MKHQPMQRFQSIIKPNDSCFNINSLFYKNSSNNLEVNRVEFERLNSITKKLKINNDVIYSIQDWIDTDNLNNQNLEERLSLKIMVLHGFPEITRCIKF